MTATIRRMARPRGTLTEKQVEDIGWAKKERDAGEARYRRAVVRALTEGASYAEVSKATGLSTNTLQRWKREAR